MPGRNLVNANLTFIKPERHIGPQQFGNFWKNKLKPVPRKVQPLLPKQMVPDCGKGQHENHSHSKTRLHDYHDSVANVTNSAFYSVSLPADL